MPNKGRRRDNLIYLAQILLLITTVARCTFGNEPIQASAVTPKPCASPAASAAADALAAKFDQHQFVFIGSTHGDAKIEEFLTCLISRPAFYQRVTDIVVEWASSGHQRLIDRYMISLDKIATDDLAPIWFDTDAPTMWTTLPQVRQFLRDIAR